MAGTGHWVGCRDQERTGLCSKQTWGHQNISDCGMIAGVQFTGVCPGWEDGVGSGDNEQGMEPRCV